MIGLRLCNLGHKHHKNDVVPFLMHHTGGMWCWCDICWWRGVWSTFHMTSFWVFGKSSALRGPPLPSQPYMSKVSLALATHTQLSQASWVEPPVVLSLQDTSLTAQVAPLWTPIHLSVSCAWRSIHNGYSFPGADRPIQDTGNPRSCH